VTPNGTASTAVAEAKARGRPRAHEREVINGIFYVLSTGCRWEDLPHDIAASLPNCNRRLLDYQRRRAGKRFSVN